jgi:hypothetical protein
MAYVHPGGRISSYLDDVDAKAGRELVSGSESSNPDAAADTLKVEDPRDRKLRRFHAATQLLPRDKALQECHRMVIPGKHVTLWIHNETKRAHFNGLIQCHQVWTCPICSSKISERKREELQIALDNWTGSVALGTFTLQHHKGTSLKTVLGLKNRAWRAMTASHAYKDLLKRYGVAGLTRSREITYSDVNGWHPHFHAIFWFAGSRESVDLDQLERELSAMWIYQVKRVGGWALAPYACNVERGDSSVADYVAKFGSDYEDNDLARSLADRTTNATWKAADELCKANIKKAREGRNPWQLLDSYADGDKQAGALFQEYAAATKGLHQLQWSRGLRERVGLGREATDQEIVEEYQDDCTLVHTFTQAEWKAVLANDCVAILLQAAETLEQDELERFVISLAA